MITLKKSWKRRGGDVDKVKEHLAGISNISQIEKREELHNKPSADLTDSDISDYRKAFHENFFKFDRNQPKIDGLGGMAVQLQGETEIKANVGKAANLGELDSTINIKAVSSELGKMDSAKEAMAKHLGVEIVGPGNKPNETIMQSGDGLKYTISFDFDDPKNPSVENLNKAVDGARSGGQLRGSRGKYFLSYMNNDGFNTKNEEFDAESDLTSARDEAKQSDPQGSFTVSLAENEDQLTDLYPELAPPKPDISESAEMTGSGDMNSGSGDKGGNILGYNDSGRAVYASDKGAMKGLLNLWKKLRKKL